MANAVGTTAARAMIGTEKRMIEKVGLVVSLETGGEGSSKEGHLALKWRRSEVKKGNGENSKLGGPQAL